MEIFRINENEQSQFVRIPEVAMDLNFGQSTAKFYMVVSCRIAILLDENTFTESEDSYFRLPEGTNVPPEARTRDFMRWFDSLPLVPTIETATPQQAWESFAGAIGPVTPSGAFPVPPPPPRPPSIYGHLPFKATTLADTVIYRWEAYPISRRINIHANPPNVAKDTYAAPGVGGSLRPDRICGGSAFCTAESHARLLPLRVAATPRHANRMWGSGSALRSVWGWGRSEIRRADYQQRRDRQSNRASSAVIRVDRNGIQGFCRIFIGEKGKRTNDSKGFRGRLCASI